ncbi:MAG TPA: helical backbone metal receptor [Wenzhouxiangella sp.]|nr:helical backbone metal receptor [Wenzhouxiangella sp.]
MRLALGILALTLCNPVISEPVEKLRVIALAPHLAELVYSAGGGESLIGTVAWSDYPPAARELPRIGDAFRLDLERIMMLDPDLALAWRGGTPSAAAQRLEALGIEVIWIPIRTLDDIGKALEQLGQRLGHSISGQRAAAAFRAALAARPPFPPEDRQPAFYQVSDRPLFTLGNRHIVGEVLHRCGAYNVFSDLDTEAAAVDFEAVLARRPAVIIAGAEPGDENVLERWQKNSELLAQPVRFIEIAPDTLIRPTPRIIDGIDQLCRLME